MEKLRQRFLKKLNAPYPKKFVPSLMEFSQSEYNYFMNKFSKEYDQEEQKREQKREKEKAENEKKKNQANKNSKQVQQVSDDEQSESEEEEDEGVFCTFFDMDVEIDDFIQLTTNHKISLNLMTFFLNYFNIFNLANLIQQYGKPLVFDIYKITRDIDKKILPLRFKQQMKLLIQDEFNANQHIFVVMLIFQANRWVTSVARLSQESIYVKDFKSSKEKDVDEFIMPCITRALKDFYFKEPEEFYEIVNLGDRWRENQESDSGLECLYFIYKFISGQEIEKIQHTKWEILSLLEYFTWILLKIKYQDWKKQIQVETQTAIELKEQDCQTNRIVIGDQMEILEEKIEQIDELKNKQQNLQKNFDELLLEKQNLDIINGLQQKRISDLEIYDNSDHKNKFELFIAKERELVLLNDQLQRKISILHHEQMLQKKQNKNLKEKYRELLNELYTYQEREFIKNDQNDRIIDNKPQITDITIKGKKMKSLSRENSLNGSFSLPYINIAQQSIYSQQSSKSNKRFQSKLWMDLEDQKDKSVNNLYTPQIKKLYDNANASNIFKKKLHQKQLQEVGVELNQIKIEDNKKQDLKYTNLLLQTGNQQIQLDFQKIKNVPSTFTNFKLKYEILHLSYCIYENTIQNFKNKIPVTGNNNFVDIDISNQIDTFRTVLNKDLQIKFELTFLAKKDDKKFQKSNFLFSFFTENNNSIQQGIKEVQLYPGKQKLLFQVIESIEEINKNSQLKIQSKQIISKNDYKNINKQHSSISQKTDEKKKLLQNKDVLKLQQQK